MSLNLVLLQGRAGGDPEKRTSSSGTSIATLSIATEYSVKKDGEWQKNTSWHRVIAFGSTADYLANYCQKGSAVGIQGHLSYSTYEKDGVKVYKTDIIVDSVTMLVEPPVKSEGKPNRHGKDGTTALPENQEGSNQDYPPDDIPF